MAMSLARLSSTSKVESARTLRSKSHSLWRTHSPFTTDPQMRPILEEACLFCWEAYRKDYSPSADRRRFLRDYSAGRFITVALLDAAWEECKRVEKDSMRSALFNHVGNEAVEPIESSSSLDRMDDAGIDDLYHRTLREYARTVKRQYGLRV